MEKALPKNTNGCKKTGDGFVFGVLVLTLSNFLVKIAGLLFKVPMNHIVGDTVMGYYNSAYSVYTFFYMLSTAGLPVALSVMISENKSRGNIFAAKLIYRLAMSIFILTGLIVCLIMLLAPDFLAQLIRCEKSAMSIMAVAPTMLFICVSSAVRGYFQGTSNMIPTAVSQLIEAIGKLGVGIAAALYAVRMGYEIHVIAAYAVSGLTIGSLAGAVYLVITKATRRERDLLCEVSYPDRIVPKKRDILGRFMKISFPITVSASVMSLTNIIDTVMIQRILRSCGMTEEAAATLYGNYTSLVVPMFNLPPVFVYPIAYSLVPVVAAAFASGKRDVAAHQTELSLRYAVMIGLPCALGLSILADPILCMIYKESSAHLAAPLLSCLAPSSLFVCVLAVTNSVLQGCGREGKPVISMLAGALVKCAASSFLLRRYGIYGAPVSTFICYLTVTVLNFAFVVKYTGIRLTFRQTFLRPLLSGVMCALCATAAYNLLCPITGLKVACLISIFASATVYLLSLLLMGAVGVDEIKRIPLIGKLIKRKI